MCIGKAAAAFGKTNKDLEENSTSFDTNENVVRSDKVVNFTVESIKRV